MRVLIAGGGQVGALIARRLANEGNEVSIVDASAERCAQLEEQLDARVVSGSASRIETLRRAGLSDAEMVIAVTDSDEVNLLACLIAQAESGARVKIARLRTHEVEHWHRVAEAVGLHIDLIIHPETDTAERIMRVVRVPGVSDIREFASGGVRLMGMNLEPGNWTIGKSIQELAAAGPPAESLIAMIFRGTQVIVPHGGEVLREGDHVYVLCAKDEFEATRRFMGLGADQSLRRVFIIGGKQAGITVAGRLEAEGVAVKLFERDQARCERIAGLLTRTIVVRGDGTDQATLEDEGLAEADAFLAMTGDDEDNVIASLLARRLGVRKVVALINKLNYLPLVQRLGVNTTVSPRLATVDRVLQFVRKGRVLSVTTFRQEEAEAIEFLAAPRMKYVGTPLRQAGFPRGAIVGAIVRPDGRVVVPRGDDVVQPEDRVIVFALERVIPALEAGFVTHAARSR
jgi:trk system potassium uptake protein TrkA